MERTFLPTLRRTILTGIVTALMLPGAAHAAPGVPDPAPRHRESFEATPGGAPRAGARAAAASWSSWWLRSDPVTFTKNGVSYQLILQASEYEEAGVDNDVYLSFDVRKTNDPAGVKKATQYHNWSFSGLTDRFTHRSTLSRAAVDSGDDLAPYGKVAIRFRQNAALKEKCGGGFLRRRGTLSGLLELKTGPSALGKITKLPTTATLHRYASSASCGGGGGPAPCPTPTRWVYGSRSGSDDLYLSAWKRDGARVAHVYASRYGALSPTAPGVSGWLSHSIWARMASSRLDIATDLSTATVRGASGTWLSGTATFAPSGPLRESGANGCGSAGTKEYLYKSRDGSMTGTLTADFLVGPDRTVGAGGMDAQGSRLVVRAI